MLYFVEVLLAGLLVGSMYSVVALGYVLVFKASRIFNFAHGAMVLFGALTFVGFLEWGLPLWPSLIVAVATMVATAVLVERVVLRPLAAQSELILFMATVGLNIFLEGFAQALWGTQPHGADQFLAGLGLRDAALSFHGLLVSQLELVAGGVAILLVILAHVGFQHTQLGRAARAIADDKVTALSLGVPLSMIWAVIWALGGVSALIAGILWAARLGVQYSLSVIVLKALPVLVLGGFDSILGVLLAGPLVGASEKVAEVFVGSYVGGGIESFVPYLIALPVLYLRPFGMLGDPTIERV